MKEATLWDIISGKSLSINSTCKLKNALVKFGVLEYKCKECGQLGWWNGKPLVLELDHIDGNNRNNLLENLRILCIHCHSQTDTYRSKNRKIPRKPDRFCSECNVKVCKQNVTGLCNSCCNKIRVREMNKARPNINYGKCPSKEQLIKDIQELRTNVAIGKKYEVSDNAVKKWKKKYDIQYIRPPSDKCPDKEQLIKDIEELKTNVAIGKKYGVDGSCIRLWKINFDIQKK